MFQNIYLTRKHHPVRILADSNMGANSVGKNVIFNKQTNIKQEFIKCVNSSQIGSDSIVWTSNEILGDSQVLHESSNNNKSYNNKISL